MNSSTDKILYKSYKQLKSIYKNEQNEIILAKRISDDKKVVIKQSVLLNNNFTSVTKLGHEYDILKDLDQPGIPRVF